MNRKDYEEYRRLDDSLKSVREFANWCGKKYRDRTKNKSGFKLVTKGTKLFIKVRKCIFFYHEETYEIPDELQDWIIDTVECYLDEKEGDLSRL